MASSAIGNAHALHLSAPRIDISRRQDQHAVLCYPFQQEDTSEQKKQNSNSENLKRKSFGRNCHSDGQDLLAIASLLQGTVTLDECQHIHDQIVLLGLDGETYLGNLLISIYGKYGHLGEARSTFDSIRCPSVVSWTAIIDAYIKEGNPMEAFKLFLDMELHGVKPDKVTFICLLRACNHRTYLPLGKLIHCCMIDQHIDMDIMSGNVLITMYEKCGALHDAIRVFQGMFERDVVTWNALIAAHANCGNSVMAIELFREMQGQGLEPDCITFVNVLGACDSPADLSAGEALHASIINAGFGSNDIVHNSIVSMYGRCRALTKAWFAFHNSRHNEVVSWSCMIEVLSNYGHAKEALHLIMEMENEGFKPNTVIFLSALGACCGPPALSYGKTIHACICNARLESDMTIGNALISMYNRCGSIDEACSVFKGMHQANVVTWSAMIATYADHGLGKEALELFNSMQQKGLKPNAVTFVSLLVACCHSGLLEEGKFFLSCMGHEFGLAPTIEHYSCMIDLLGKAGRLSEAEDMINEIPFQLDAQAWSILLGACNLHGDVERGARAARHVLALDPRDTGAYVLLSNLYASAESA